MLMLTAGAGACIPAGAAVARIHGLHPGWLESEFRHFVMAFGGGVLVAAVALVLLPQGVTLVASPVLEFSMFLLGGVVLFALERLLARRKVESPLLIATLLDYVPESMALGGAFAVGLKEAPLLALLIGLQNLPEGFNAYRELGRDRSADHGRALVGLAMLVPLGPVLGSLGWYFLSKYTPVLGAIMLASSGGILYLVFQDIAPQSRLKRHWFPPLGAVFGFGIALLGQLLLEA